MEEPLTEELLDELLCAPSAESFIDQHGAAAKTLPQMLQELLDEKRLSRPSAIREAGLNATFGYQIFTGSRNPSRNKVLQLAFALHATLKETNRLLQAAGTNSLYCKDRRDAIIIFCINKQLSLHETEEQLYHFNEQTICN